jgi:hypothetical protein
MSMERTIHSARHYKPAGCTFSFDGLRYLLSLMNANDSSFYRSALKRIQEFRLAGHWPLPPRPQNPRSAQLKERISSCQSALHKLHAKSMTEPWPSMWDED